MGHRGVPREVASFPFGREVAQGEVEQLGRRLVGQEMATDLRIFRSCKCRLSMALVV